MASKRRKRKRKSHYHRGEHTSSKTGQICKYRSGWEELYMKYLDSNPDIETWTYEKTVIEYISNIRTNKIRKYYPDFYVKYRDGREVIIEVKPKRKLEQAIVMKKMTAAQSWCQSRGMSYQILTEVELKDLGIL